MARFCPLASGSKGNALLLESQEAKILIDVGIGVRTLEQRLSEMHIAITELDAILISHEHTDHIGGVASLLNRIQVPIFANAETASALCSTLGFCPSFKIFETGERFRWKDLEIYPFSVPHDTMDPVGFRIECGKNILGICTDAGFPTSWMRQALKGCHYLYVEANHEPDMVHASSRPMIYKQRVLSRQGHLSNEASADLIRSILHPGLEQVYLAHLSEECNTPTHALDRVQSCIGTSLSLHIAQQHVRSKELLFHD